MTLVGRVCHCHQTSGTAFQRDNDIAAWMHILSLCWKPDFHFQPLDRPLPQLKAADGIVEILDLGQIQ